MIIYFCYFQSTDDENLDETTTTSVPVYRAIPYDNIIEFYSQIRVFMISLFFLSLPNTAFSHAQNPMCRAHLRSGKPKKHTHALPSVGDAQNWVPPLDLPSKPGSPSSVQAVSAMFQEPQDAWSVAADNIPFEGEKHAQAQFSANATAAPRPAPAAAAGIPFNFVAVSLEDIDFSGITNDPATCDCLACRNMRASVGWCCRCKQYRPLSQFPAADAYNFAVADDAVCINCHPKQFLTLRKKGAVGKCEYWYGSFNAFVCSLQYPPPLSVN
jgi:hypothetical protein